MSWNMEKCCVVLILLVIVISVSYADRGVPLRQERARITYYNPKYIKDGEVFTGRRSRHEPYLTNMTGTILVTLQNNVSCGTDLVLTNGNNFKLFYKTCEAFKLKWIADYIQTFSDVPIRCPVVADTYHFFNMQLPPKQFPLVVKSDSDFDISCFLTDTHEKIFIVTIGLRKSAEKSNKRIG